MNFTDELPCHSASIWIWPVGGIGKKSVGRRKGNQDAYSPDSLFVNLLWLAACLYRRPQLLSEGLFLIATLLAGTTLSSPGLTIVIGSDVSNFRLLQQPSLVLINYSSS